MQLMEDQLSVNVRKRSNASQPYLGRPENCGSTSVCELVNKPVARVE